MRSGHADLLPAELLSIEGEDAIAFAHAQFTSDVQALAVDGWHWSAWLDAQGRARHFFALLRTGPTALLAWQPLGDAAAMRDAMRRFVLRARVRLECVDAWRVHAASADEMNLAAVGALARNDGGFALSMPGASARVALLAPSAGPAAEVAALARWRRADIEARLPLLAPASSGEFVPQALELDRIGAIRFDKGCYPGQEIVARLHFRGGNKRHLHTLLAASALAPATRILAGDVPAGSVLYCAPLADGRHVALSVLADEHAQAPSLRSEGGEAVSRADTLDIYP